MNTAKIIVSTAIVVLIAGASFYIFNTQQRIQLNEETTIVTDKDSLNSRQEKEEEIPPIEEDNLQTQTEPGGTLATEETLAEEEKERTEQKNQITYYWHRAITATVFWVGEPIGNGSSEDNTLSCWDDEWQKHFGGYDDPYCRDGYYPCTFTPKDQNFYVSVPYTDFDNNGKRKDNALSVVPWAKNEDWTGKSMMKGRWIQVERQGRTCYAQVNDCGPYIYNDWEYVFGVNGKESNPINTRANNAGMDVSPALRDCLQFEGLNNAENKIDWRFVEENEVPEGPWREKITSSSTFWR